MNPARRSPGATRPSVLLPNLVYLAAALLVALFAGHASAYTVEYCKTYADNEYCKTYADKVVQESTGTELSYAMRGTTSDPGLSGIVGSGSAGGGDTNLSSILGGLTQSQEQQSLWQRTFDHCMGVTR